MPIHGSQNSAAKAIDPICGMAVDPAKAAATRKYDETTFYFCSAGCAKEFDTDPHRYVHHQSGSNGGSTGAHHGH